MMPIPPPPEIYDKSTGSTWGESILDILLIIIVSIFSILILRAMWDKIC